MKVLSLRNKGCNRLAYASVTFDILDNDEGFALFRNPHVSIQATSRLICATIDIK